MSEVLREQGNEAILGCVTQRRTTIGVRLEVGPLVGKFNRINCFLFTFCHDTKSNKKIQAVRKFLQNYGSVFSPKPKLFISEKFNSYIAFSQRKPNSTKQNLVLLLNFLKATLLFDQKTWYSNRIIICELGIRQIDYKFKIVQRIF